MLKLSPKFISVHAHGGGGFMSSAGQTVHVPSVAVVVLHVFSSVTKVLAGQEEGDLRLHHDDGHSDFSQLWVIQHSGNMNGYFHEETR